MDIWSKLRPSQEEIAIKKERIVARKDLQLAKIKAEEAKYISKRHYQESKINADAKLSKAIALFQSTKNNNHTAHLWWVIGILAILLIGFSGYILCYLRPQLCNVDTADWLSIISLVLSIVLSIFAIMYTYTSNAQIQDEFKDINKAANDISTSSNEIRTSVKQYEEIASKILNAVNDVPKAVAQQLSTDTSNKSFDSGASPELSTINAKAEE
ncbi:MAG: prominin family protein [Bacteroidales bacterium]|nr:prominin family protein [Bacteroidales bacterium]